MSEDAAPGPTAAADGAPDDEPGVEEAAEAERDEASSADADPEVLRTRLDLLEAENDRLRASYARAKRSQYTRSAAGFVVLGAVALLGAAAFEQVRTVLLALGGTGLFVGLATYYLTPERFVSATVGESVSDAVAATGAGLVAELGLADVVVYVPTPTHPTDPARVFVPQHREFDLPDPDALASLFVGVAAAAHRGVSLRPSAATLYAEFEATRRGPEPDDPAALATQLGEALTAQFELVDDVTVAAESDRVLVGVSGPAAGDLADFDHPVTSLLGVGLARGLERPVEVAVSDALARADQTIVLEWGALPDANAPEDADVET